MQEVKSMGADIITLQEAFHFIGTGTHDPLELSSNR